MRADELEEVVDRHHAERDSDGQIDLLVLPTLAVAPSDEALAAAALVDLLASPDARDSHAARQALERSAAGDRVRPTGSRPAPSGCI